MLATILRVECVVPDNDGDVAINIPNGQLYVRVLDDLPIVRVFTLPLTGVHPSSSLYEAANELNRSYSGLKAVVGNDALFLVADVVAWPFVGDHVQTAMLDVAWLLLSSLAHWMPSSGTAPRLPRTDAGYL